MKTRTTSYIVATLARLHLPDPGPRVPQRALGSPDPRRMDDKNCASATENTLAPAPTGMILG